MDPENLSLMPEEDKDIWEMLKVQSFLEEFCAGEKLGLKQGNVFSRKILSHTLCSSNLKLLLPETSLPSLEGWPRTSFQSNREYQNQLCSNTAYVVYNRVYTTDRKQSGSGTVIHLFYWLWSLLETRPNHYGLCYIITSSCDSRTMNANSVLNLRKRLFTDLASNVCLG